MPKQEDTSRKLVGLNPVSGKIFLSRDISVKVCLYEHLALEFVH